MHPFGSYSAYNWFAGRLRACSQQSAERSLGKQTGYSRASQPSREMFYCLTALALVCMGQGPMSVKFSTHLYWDQTQSQST